MFRAYKAHMENMGESGPSDRKEEDLVRYLEVKQQLLYSYCTNIVFYLLLKVEGKSVKDHPVMKQLLEIRYAMEKLRSTDNKLKSQIDRLLKYAESNKNDSGSSTLRPNPMALLAADSTSKKKEVVSDDSMSADGSDMDSDSDEDVGQASGVYKPPKMNAAIYKENETAAQKAENALLKQRRKLKNSEILETLREEFSSAPENSSSTGLLGKTQEERRIEEDMEERRKFEEDRFVRLSLTRKDKQAVKRRERELMKGGLGADDLLVDIGDVEELDSLVNKHNKVKRGEDPAVLQGLEVLREAMEQQKNNSSQKSLEYASQKLRKQETYSEDEDDAGFRAMLDAEDAIPARRRPAPMDEDDEEESMLESFSKKKREYVEEKGAHHNAHKVARYGGYDGTVEEGEKRKASYQILKNRGLVPHRKLSNRNPRVKKREAYHKAVVARKGQVRETKTPETAYGGEMTGIKANISRSRRLDA